MTAPDHVPPFSARSALRSPEFWLLFVAAMAAGFGLSGWTSIPATIAGLLISSLPKYLPLYPRAKVVGAVAAFRATVLASVLNATIVGVAVFLLGRATWWLWGCGLPGVGASSGLRADFERNGPAALHAT